MNTNKQALVKIEGRSVLKDIMMSVDDVSRGIAMCDLAQLTGFALSDFNDWIEQYKSEQTSRIPKYKNLDFEKHFKINFINLFSNLELITMLKNTDLSKVNRWLGLENAARIEKNYVQTHDFLALALWLERIGLREKQCTLI